jgi:adenylate cyclase
MDIDEEGTLATLSAFRLVTDCLIARHEGRICGTAGDSILAAFCSALAAVQCAVDIQNELAHSNNDLEKERRMQFRIGINVGDVMLKDGDIFGDGGISPHALPAAPGRAKVRVAIEPSCDTGARRRGRHSIAF